MPRPLSAKPSIARARKIAVLEQMGCPSFRLFEAFAEADKHSHANFQTVFLRGASMFPISILSRQRASVVISQSALTTVIAMVFNDQAIGTCWRDAKHGECE